MGSRDYKLYALNSDGTLKWAYKTGNRVYSSPAIGADGTVYVGSNDHKLYALNSDGTLKWAYKTGWSVSSSPAIGADGTVYVGSVVDKLYALNSDGTLKWSYKTGESIDTSSPAIGADGTVYVGSNDGKLYALNSDGTLKWAYDTGLFINSSPAIGSDGMVYVGSGRGKLYALNSDGTLKWFYQTGAYSLKSSPAIGADGTVYVGSNDWKFYALNSDGTIRWTYEAGHHINSSPAIGTDGTVYVGSDDYKLNAFSTSDIGIAQWPKYRFDNKNTGALPLKSIIAQFSSDITSGNLPLTVQFSDNSTGAITSWVWDFGDGNTSKEQNPLHTYETVGTFTVTLTVTGTEGSDAVKKENYISVTNPPVVVENRISLPISFAIYQNYPNPFNPSTQIEYDVKEACKVNLVVYNLNGQVVNELVHSHKQPGKYSDNLNLQYLPSGIYFYKIKMGGFQAVKKMVKVE